MSEHLVIYGLAGHVRSVRAELARMRIPEYRRSNLGKILGLMDDEVRFLLDNHDCARCARLRGERDRLDDFHGALLEAEMNADPCAGGCTDPEIHAEGGHDV